MKVVVTGAGGFIGKNLTVALGEVEGITVLPITRGSSREDLERALSVADAVVHLAGVNRPLDPVEFSTGNAENTRVLCKFIAASRRRPTIIYASSIQAERDSPYGLSKRAAEDFLFEHARATGAALRIFRLPNVFGKWARPDYNSVVATFCYHIARREPITIRDPAAAVQLVYVDDVIAAFRAVLAEPGGTVDFGAVAPVYRATVGELAEQITDFREKRDTLITERVGTGLTRALYSTYISYLTPEQFSYSVPKHVDPRGVFVEMLKTRDSGQFSFFTARPGITRGGHYHHTKTEKFLVIRGKARFRFRHIVSDETFELVTDGDEPAVVETIPGWAHDITNLGDEDMIVMLWANEIFDREQPDTYSHRV